MVQGWISSVTVQKIMFRTSGRKIEGRYSMILKTLRLDQMSSGNQKNWSDMCQKYRGLPCMITKLSEWCIQFCHIVFMHMCCWCTGLESRCLIQWFQNRSYIRNLKNLNIMPDYLLIREQIKYLSSLKTFSLHFYHFLFCVLTSEYFKNALKCKKIQPIKTVLLIYSIIFISMRF